MLVHQRVSIPNIHPLSGYLNRDEHPSQKRVVYCKNPVVWNPHHQWMVDIYIYTYTYKCIYIYTHRYYNNVTATWLEWRIGLRYAELFGSVNYLSPSMFFFFPIWQILQFWLVWTLAIAYGYPRIFPLHPIKSHGIFKNPLDPQKKPQKMPWIDINCH